MSIQTKQRDGRKWSVDGEGIKDLERTYVVVLDTANLPANGETPSFTGVPAIGTAHPTIAGLVVESYKVSEGQGAAKNTISVTVSYGRKTLQVTGKDPEDPEEKREITAEVTEWGWDAATDEKELVSDADGTPVLNSAGDPFERVPSYSGYAPVFTKVMKFKKRQAGAMAYNCSVNSKEMTIGDLTAEPGQLLCSVAEKLIFDDPDWRYQYTVNLKYKSNIVSCINGSGSSTEIGWDVAVTDAGMRALDENGKAKLISVIDKETGKRCTVSSPELLNGEGGVLDRETSTTPYVFRFKTYERKEFPQWFYSEPVWEAASTEDN